MPRIIMKPKADVDFYVEYSTVVDSPVSTGTREYYEKRGESAERMDRVDEKGTSVLWGDPEDLFLGWNDTEIQIREILTDNEPDEPAYATINREDLQEFCESMPEDYRTPHPKSYLLTWHLFED